MSSNSCTRTEKSLFRFIWISIIFSLLLATQSFSATLTLTTKYGATGGLAGDFNSVGDQVNGRNICPAVNDYANATAGCDMSGDAGYSDNGTGDPSDDTYNGDLIVRTNDSFEVGAKYSWLGNAGGAEEEVTITGTLPVGKGFIWDGIPGACDQTLSSLSADKKSITCIRKDFDTNDVGSYSELLNFAVKVEGDAVNGSVPGDITFSIEEPTGTAGTPSDGVEDGNAANLLKVTASPRWNIDKHSGAGYYTTSYGVTDDAGNPGWYLWYNFTIEVDEVPTEADDPINPSLGNEALKGGTSATVTFTDDLSDISPNAKLVTWDSNANFSPASNACDMDTYTNSDEPYPAYNATYPERSIPTPAGVMGVTCTQTGTSVAVEVTGIDGTLTNAPIRNRNGGLLPVNRNIAAIGVMRVFVPLSDVEAGEDGIAGNGDDGQLTTTNCLTDFDPVGISDGANFNGINGGESEADNCRNLTLYAARGSWSKSYRKGWSDQADQIAEWGGEGWWYPPTDASLVMAGDGSATPGSVWGTYTVYRNTGGTDIADPMICDVIDVERYEMTLLDPNTDNPATFVDDREHAVDLNYGWTEGIAGIKVEYAVGYVAASWPPDPDVVPGNAIAIECNSTSVTWYDTYTEAATHGAVSKARLSAPVLPVQKYMAMRIKHTARSTHLSDGTPIQNNELLVNYATYKSALTNDKYASNGYRPHDATTNHEGGWSGDRLIMQRAKVRILKDMAPTAVSPGSEVTVTLTPSFTTDGPNPEDSNVQIVDVLPKGLSYTVGSTTGTYGAGATPYGEPQVFAPATDAECNTYAAAVVAEGHPCGTLNGGTGDESILVWDLGTQTTGTVYNNLNFTVMVPVDAPSGVLANYAQIESPADGSAPSKRIDNANVSNSVPSSLLIVKSVQTPLHEINKGALLNWMEFRVGLRNGASTPLTELDIIDILPFNGDGVLGSFTFTPLAGTTVPRNRTPATDFSGTFQFDSISFDDNGECDATAIEYWFTNAAGPLDISPLHTSNTKADGTPEAIWCEGTIAGPDGGCGFTNTNVTAVRTRGVGMTASGTCFMNLKFATTSNVDEDIYSNTAGSTAKASDGSNLDGVLSNTVSAKVYASSIGSKVWFDNDRDGIQAANGEPGIDGVTVNLYDAGGNLITTTTTAGGGLYNFPNLISGDYVVEVVPPVGYLVTDQNQGGNSALDSDIDTGTNRTGTITLGEDENNIDIDAGLYAPTISGNLFDDGNGDGDINGAPISAPDGTQLYVNLVDAAGNVIAVKPLAADGTYSFDDADGVRANTDYTLVLSTTQGTVGQPAPTADLPANWNNADGENINSAGTGNDGQNANGEGDGIIVVSVGTVDVPQVDFGINHAPVANDKTEPSVLNPGGTTQVAVPTLNYSDTEDGIPSTITITELPNNATLYYNGQPVVAGTPITNFNPALLTVDPIDGDQTVVFKYTTTDAASVVSNVATVTLPFTGLEISGNVFDDGSGNNTVDGRKFNNPDGVLLHATLLAANGAVLATTPIAADGSYNFDGADGIAPNTNYSVLIATTPSATTPSLPIKWNNADGENIGAGVGTDGTANGIIAVSVVTANIPEINFGINKKPEAQDVTEPIQLNPGGTTQVAVPNLPITDNEDGTPTTVTITTLPNNAILYYNGAPVAAGQVIPNFDPALLTVDPIDGDQIVVFTYTTTDAAGAESDPATVTLPFAGLGIAGTLFNDGNGDGNINGTPISAPDGTQLYVNLVDVAGNVMAVKPLAADGTYQFIGTDGVTANTMYTVVLSTIQGTVGQPAPTADLPANWSNADGENINSASTGNDGSPDGVIRVSLSTVAILQVDFGINHRPVVQDVTEASQPNPSGDTQYPVPNLPITDAEDGTPTTVTITTLPDPETGILYYKGTAVTAGQVIPNFDPALLTVDPTDGNPTMIFTYTTTDAAGVESDPATVTMPFLGDMYVGNRVWMDTNGNGVQDQGEGNIAGVTVNLYSDDGTLIASTETNSSGEYIFKVEEEGNYYVEFDSAYSYTVQNNGDDAFDSDVDPSTFRTDTFSLNYGDNDMSHDAGIAPTAHIGDFFWIDSNQNGIQDPGEQPVIGATVELFDINGNPVADANGNYSVVTDANGRYGFDVVPDDYQVRFTLPPTGYEGYIFSSENQGNNDGSDTDVNGKGFTQIITVVAGENNLTLDAGINCGCEDAPIKANGGDALGLLGMLAMMLMTLMTALFFVRKEEEQRV